MKTYQTYIFENKPQWDKVPLGKVDFFNWESDDPFRPTTEFKLCLVKNQGFFLKMKTDETDIRAVCQGRDENCWEDSCMEFFIKPFSDEEEYMNFEMTAKGAYLSAVGKDRNERVFLKALTDKEPSVNAQILPSGWELELFIPHELIESVFKKKFTFNEQEYKGNFFKCADKAAKPHFASFSPMGELPPGFHNPKLFANIIVKEFKL